MLTTRRTGARQRYGVTHRDGHVPTAGGGERVVVAEGLLAEQRAGFGLGVGLDLADALGGVVVDLVVLGRDLLAVSAPRGGAAAVFQDYQLRAQR